MVHARCYDAQSNAGENIGIVALASFIDFAIVFHWREWGTTGKYAASLKYNKLYEIPTLLGFQKKYMKNFVSIIVIVAN